jgi:hypothetical protein
MNVIDGGAIYEGELSSYTDFHNLFIGVTTAYQVDPVETAKHWPCITLQCQLLQIPMVPDEERYRFNRTPVIVLH